MAVRRHPEDSVIVSIGDVREMLAEEVSKQHEVTQPRLPVPLAVPAEVVGGVPSWEEVGASREARWQREQERLAPVRAVPPWRIWRRRVILGLGAVVICAATAVAMWQWLPPPGTVEQVADRVRSARQETSHRVAAHEAREAVVAALAEADRLRAEVGSLQVALTAARAAPPEPIAQPAEIIQETSQRPPPRGRLRARVSRVAGPADPSGVRRPRAPRKPRTLNKTDEKLDSLLKGL